MSGSLFDDDDRDAVEASEWLKPIYEDEEPEMPGTRFMRSPIKAPPPPAPPVVPSVALSEADTLLARLDASAAAASDAVRYGLVARMAVREAAGWLAHTSHSIHPNDLALREAGVTGSYLAAASAGKLAAEMPYTVREAGWQNDAVPEDRTIVAGLVFARSLRRLAEIRTWAPLSDATKFSKTMEALGLSDGLAEIAVMDWMDVDRSLTAPLLAAFDEANSWSGLDRGNDHNDVDLRASFIAAATMTAKGRLTSVPLPFWMGRAALGMRRPDGLFMPQQRSTLINMVIEGAKTALGELDRLAVVSQNGSAISRTKRSRIGDAIDAAVRTPVLTAASLGKRLKITPQAAARLLVEMAEAKIVREATGRKSFRAYVI